jgi:glycosyltransferase involved in cell wall biosynthesis
MRRHFSAARRVWFVSEENRLDLQTCLAVPLPQTEVIANAYGCAYDPPDSWPQGESPANPPLRLALVSRLEIRQKGQDLLFTSLARPEWRKRPLHVTLFGGGPNEAALRARAQNLGLLNVHFAGHADDISSVWKTHHALLLPSRFEGQSLAMIEAMLHARPVIAMPVGGVGGVVIDGRTGFVASAVTESAWNEAMERAWLRRTEWPAIGREARAHIKNIVGPDPGRALAEQIRKIADAPR